jgi:hypothetical protein
MKRKLINAAIGGYLCALVVGVGCVVTQVRFFWPPLYFLTFDMYGGWSGYDCKMQIIGEGESGRFYVLSPGPWGPFNPYSERLSRQCYDQAFEYGRRLARPGLAHTTHEPILRIFVVEQEYPRKFNLPDAQYQAYYRTPKPDRIYSHLRMVLTPEGEVLRQSPVWLQYQDNLSISDNPRLVAQAASKRPFLWSAVLAPGSGGNSGDNAPTGALERSGAPVTE